MKNIDYKKLRKYDIGKMSSIGYEIGSQLPEFYSESKLGDNLSSDIDYYKQQFTPQLISKSSLLLLAASPFLSQLSKNIAKTTAEEGAKTIGKTTASSLATGAITSAMSALQLYGDTISAQEKIDPNLMLSTSNQYTDSKFGQQYSVYGGVNKDAITNYIDQRNKIDRVNLTTDYASTGASVGSTIGSIWGPLGSGLGLLIGGMAGTGLGISRADKYNDDRKLKAAVDMSNINNSFSGYNTQSEAVAASKGLRQMYAYNMYGADKGKSQNQKLGYPGKIGMVHTKNGIEPGIQYGLGGGGETIIDPNTQSVSVIEEGKKRVDNIPVGVPLNSPNPDQEWNDLIILGNSKNRATGKNIADEARPYARAIENDDDKMDRISQRTKELNKRNAYAKLMSLADTQAENKQRGDMYKADWGKNDWGLLSSMILPRIAQFGIINAANKKITPTATNPYASANVQNQLNALYSLYHDPSLAIQNAKDAGRQATYAINTSGGITGGQKAAIRAMSNHATAKSVNDIIAAYNDKNIESRRAALGASIQAAESDAARRQQGNLYYADAYARANAVKYAQQQNYLKSLHDMFGSIGKDFASYYNNIAARDFQQQIIDAYNKNLGTKTKENTPKKPATKRIETTVTEPTFGYSGLVSDQYGNLRFPTLNGDYLISRSLFNP